ncbi:MAG: trigger factor [Rhodospirillales bacterium]|nr:trigger factor [Rhodospirillales bacterium]
MQVTETKSEGLTREFTVALPAKEIEEKIVHRLKEIAPTVQIPGFRPGKVPQAVLRKKYGPSVMGEVLERAVTDSYQQALAEKGLRPAMQPKIKVTKFEDGEDLEYTMAFELLPEITPIDFSKIKLERLIPKQDDAELEKTLVRIAEANGTAVPVTDARASRTGDVLSIDFVGSIDGEEFPGGKADGYDLALGSGTFIPGFEDQLTGVKAGDKVEVKVNFPDNYGAAELSGKEAIFQVTVNELKETVPAKVDDEMAKKVGMEGLEALKNTIREEQNGEFNHLARMNLKRLLLDELADAHDFDVPEKLLEQEFEQIWTQFEEQRKATKEPEGETKTDDEHKEELREIAERRIKLGLLLSEVGRLNNIEYDQEDLNKHIMAEARRNPGREQEVMDYYKNSPEAVEQLAAPVYEEKVVDFILDQATIKDKEVTMDQMMEIIKEETSDKPKKKTPAKSKSEKKPAKKAAKKK